MKCDGQSCEHNCAVTVDNNSPSSLRAKCDRQVIWGRHGDKRSVKRPSALLTPHVVQRFDDVKNIHWHVGRLEWRRFLDTVWISGKPVDVSKIKFENLKDLLWKVLGASEWQSLVLRRLEQYLSYVIWKDSPKLPIESLTLWWKPWPRTLCWRTKEHNQSCDSNQRL